MKKQIQVGLAAFGTSGRIFHAPFIENHPDFNLYAVVERHHSNSREKYAQTKLYRSFDELLTDKNIDIIVINTPVQTHYEYAKQALLQKKHLIVEKPFTVNAEQAAELIRLANESNCFLSVYQNRRYDGDFLKVQEIVQRNVLGAIKEVHIQLDRFRTEISLKKHKEDPIAGAGTLHDLGTHLIDQALVLFGFPKALFADLGKLREHTQTNDYVELILFYDNELRIRIKASILAKENKLGYLLHGDKGSFLQNRMDAQEESINNGISPSVTNWLPEITQPNGKLNTVEIQEKTIAQNGNYMNYYTAIANALLKNKTNPVPAEQALQVMQIVDAALKSHRERKVADLP